MAYRCSKFNAGCLLSCRDNSTLNIIASTDPQWSCIKVKVIEIIVQVKHVSRLRCSCELEWRATPSVWEFFIYWPQVGLSWQQTGWALLEQFLERSNIVIIFDDYDLCDLEWRFRSVKLTRDALACLRQLPCQDRLMTMTSMVSEESLAWDTHTDTQSCTNDFENKNTPPDAIILGIIMWTYTQHPRALCDKILPRRVDR